MSFSRIAQSIHESATLKLNSKVRQLRQDGAPVIHLGGGEPFTKAPREAIDHSQELFLSREIRYTAASGAPELKEAIVDYTKRYYNHSITTANVIASAGAKQALMITLQAIVDPEDEVLFCVPYWVSYPEMVRLVGARGVPVLPADGCACPRIEDIERHLTPKSKALILNSPNNPSGAVYSEQFIADVVALCEERDLYLIMDDIYHRLLFDGRQPVSCFRHAQKRGDDSRLIVINGVSKTYAMTGFRTGWAVASRPMIDAMAKIQSHQISGPSHLLQKAGVGAIRGKQDCVADLCTKLQKNRDLMVEHLRCIKGVEPMVPGGTFYCFVDFSHYEEQSAKLSNFLLEKALVVTVPGVEFGREGFLRLSTCGDAKEMVEGLKRVHWALDSRTPPTIEIGGRLHRRSW